MHAPHQDSVCVCPCRVSWEALPPAPSPGAPTSHATAECPEPLCQVWVLPSPGCPHKTPKRGVTPLSSLIRAHTGSCANPFPSMPLWLFLVGIVFAGCCQSLLVNGSSRHYPHNPCVGAWTYTPPSSSSAYALFFLDDTGLASRETRLADGRSPAMQLLQGALFRGCSHSLRFRLPRSLDLQVAPTSALWSYRAARPFTPRIAGTVTCLQLWYCYMSG